MRDPIRDAINTHFSGPYSFTNSRSLRSSWKDHVMCVMVRKASNALETTIMCELFVFLILPRRSMDLSLGVVARLTMLSTGACTRFYRASRQERRNLRSTSTIWCHKWSQLHSANDPLESEQNSRMCGGEVRLVSLVKQSSCVWMDERGTNGRMQIGFVFSLFFLLG